MKTYLSANSAHNDVKPEGFCFVHCGAVHLRDLKQNITNTKNKLVSTFLWVGGSDNADLGDEFQVSPTFGFHHVNVWKPPPRAGAGQRKQTRQPVTGETAFYCRQVGIQSRSAQ